MRKSHHEIDWKCDPLRQPPPSLDQQRLLKLERRSWFSGMDLLCKAYDSNGSDDEQQSKPKPEIEVGYRSSVGRPAKRAKPDNSLPNPNPVIGYRTVVQAPNPQSGSGKYISKRQKALMPSPAVAPDTPPSIPSSPVMGSISNANLRHDIFVSLRQLVHFQLDKKKLPSNMSIALNGHLKPVNALQWSKSHAHLLASAGMDNVICIWNVWNERQKKARAFTYHNAAVKDVKWSPEGRFILSCGYDCTSRLVDVEKGSETQVFLEDQAVTAVKFHPHNSNLFLSGGSKGLLKLWDIRLGKAVHQYIRRLGPILDVEFTVDGKQFISSSDVSSTNLSENALIVWDVSREVPLSNQVYTEAYTCTCVMTHPFEPSFVAQSNGNYIAIFSTKHPFRLDKYKRYGSHGVSGFPIKCGFSSDGEILASGSSDGNIYFYNYRTSNLLRKIKAFDQPCVDVAFHPRFTNVIAACSWSGLVSVFE